MYKEVLLYGKRQNKLFYSVFDKPTIKKENCKKQKNWLLWTIISGIGMSKCSLTIPSLDDCFHTHPTHAQLMFIRFYDDTGHITPFHSLFQLCDFLWYTPVLLILFMKRILIDIKVTSTISSKFYIFIPSVNNRKP